MSGRRIAVLNAGAATLKVALLEAQPDELAVLDRARYEWTGARDRAQVIRRALARFESAPDAFGHRVVHGGPRLDTTTPIDKGTEAELESAVDLAPLHNAVALEVIRAVREAFPGVPAFAVFDTAFHAHRPQESMRYALPEPLVDAMAIRRYGFHGIAHASLLAALAREQGRRREDVTAVTLQLGAGCSVCAIRNGRSVETSMGFTPLEGLIMATRCGDIDPAIVLRLFRAGYTSEQIEDQLTRRSGLLALAGSSDFQVISAAEAQGEERARSALRMFVYRVTLAVGAYLTLLDGDGAIVFGGGIGSHSALVRSRIAAGLSCWGVDLDAGLNDANAQGRVSRAGRPVFVFETDEERVIAEEVRSALAPEARGSSGNEG